MNKKVSALVAACSVFVGVMSAPASAQLLGGVTDQVTDLVGGVPGLGGPLNGVLGGVLETVDGLLGVVNVPDLGNTLLVESNGLTTGGFGLIGSDDDGNTVVGVVQSVAGTGEDGRALTIGGLLSGAVDTTGTTAAVGTVLPALPGL